MMAYGRWQPKSVPIVGTRRRIEALACMGWSMRALSRALGWHQDRLQVLLSIPGGGVSPANRDRIAALYDELWDKRPPERTRSERISASRPRALAARNGWAPPLAWDDDTIEDPDATPDLGADSSAWDRHPCGTSAAYRRHLRNGEQPCLACTEAHRVDRRESEARRRRVAA